MDIIITLPKTVSWKQYEKELEAVKNEDQVINFKVSNLPKQSNAGDKCYLCYNGNIIGWMKITGFKSGGFSCTTTGAWWEGNFIQRSGKFNKITPIPMKGFQGFRYFK